MLANQMDQPAAAPGLTGRLAAYCSDLQYGQLAPDVLHRTRALILDLVGGVIRARHDAESTPPLLDAVHALGLHRGDSTVFGDAAGYSPAGAALLNGALGHSLDFDDTHAAASLHPGSVVIPAALAAAEIARASGAEVLPAIVAGYDVACRLALALPAADHFEQGFQPTTTCGVFGAAAAAGRVFGLDPAGIEAAFGIALSQSAGSPQYVFNGAWTKRFQVGWAAMSGLTAACLAREGFRSPQEAIEGRYGFLQRFSAKVPAEILEGLGARHELMRTGVKPYPSCRFAHAGIDAALQFKSEFDSGWREISRVVYGTSAFGMAQVGAPVAKRQDPRTVVDAQFSAPFVLATALMTGRMNWDSYALLQDTDIRQLLPLITCEIDPDIEAEFPANMSGKLTVVRGDTAWQMTVRVPRGEPETFLDDVDLRAKFDALTAPVIGTERAAALSKRILAIDGATDMSAISI